MNIHSRTARSFALICGFVPALFLTGCGYVAEPLPPLLNIPARVGDLAAVQRGSHILAHFSRPIMTTEGVLLKHPVRLDLRINDQAIAGGVVDGGLIDYDIPASGYIGQQVRISVKVIGGNGRDAGWSNTVTLTVVTPPEQPTDFRAEAAPQGVHLSWHASGNLFVMLRRGPDDKEYQPAGQPTTSEFTDTTAEFGKTYHYIVQSLAKAGDGEAQSDLSQEIEITPVDTFAPAPPAGLTAVPSTATIELVWERGTEANIAGYRVYRALGDGAFERVADTQELPAYSDHKIESGKAYRYAVTAVKANGLEGKQSPAVEAVAP